jgi:membrane protease YdiL (CAAX protease family)
MMPLKEQLTSRRLSQLAAVALATLTFWTLASRPDVIQDDFLIESYAAVGAMTLLLIGGVFLALRFTAGGSVTYWSIEKDQLRPVAWMILTFLGVMQLAFLGLHLSGFSTPTTSEIAYLLTGTLVPAAFLQFRLIAWPARLRHASRLRLIVLGGLSLSAAALWSYTAFSLAPARPSPPGAEEIIVTMGALIVGGTLEEVLFRVLLLTVLLVRTGSRLQAVLLSSVVFGLMHVPGEVIEPVLHRDWAFLGQIAFDYAPRFVAQTLLGVALGLLWLRTGSITLISLTHALFNLGNALAFGLLAYA